MNLAVTVIGMIILIIGGSTVKIYTLKDNLYKKKVCFTVGGFFYVIILVSLSFGDMTKKIPEKILTGIILSIPMYYLIKKIDIEKKIKGNVIYYKQDSKFAKFKRLLVFLLILTSVNLIIVIFRSRYEDLFRGQLLQIAAVGGSIALFISNLFILFFIHRLEKKLGAPILEKIEDVGEEGQT